MKLDADAQPRFTSVPIPKEGENGVFTQTWYPICMSTEVGVKEVKNFPFLNGQVVAFRGGDGEAHVLSAYCPHLGANLASGYVADNKLVCGFHRWEFDGAGKCLRTGNGDPTPPGAGLFHFPVVERWGLVWAFNGQAPLWQLPDFAYPDSELIFETIEAGSMTADPVVLCCNTADYHHVRLLHGIDWSHPDPDPIKDFRWTDHSFEYDLDGVHWNETPMQFTIGIYGITLYFQQGWLDSKWFGYLAPFGIRKPGSTNTYFVVATHKGDGSPEALKKSKEFNDFAMKLEIELVGQDIPILDRIRFVQGTLTRKDKPLAMFLDMYRKMPRAHPARDFIT